MSENGKSKIRGSVAWLPVLTGVVVSLGAMLLLSAAVGAFLVIIDALPVDDGQAAELGIGGSIALVLGLFVSYLWGGYAAGRMARGQGIRNGLLVAVGALLVALAAAGGARAADLNTNLNVPWTSDRLPIEEEVIVDWGVLLGVASLLAMAAGGAYGGYRGVRWHSSLEQEAERETSDRPPLGAGAAQAHGATADPPPPPTETTSPGPAPEETAEVGSGSSEPGSTEPGRDDEVPTTTSETPPEGPQEPPPTRSYR